MNNKRKIVTQVIFEIQQNSQKVCFRGIGVEFFGFPFQEEYHFEATLPAPS